MTYFSDPKKGVYEPGPGHVGATLLSGANGCLNGCSAGVSYYSATEYPEPGLHDDQEGFAVLSGSGYAKVGDEEHELSPQTVFIVPPHTKHTIRSNSADEPVVVFWFHAPA